MNKNQNIAILKKTVASLTEKRAAFLENLGEVTGKLNAANTELAGLMGAPAPQILRVAGMTKSAAQTKGPNEQEFNAKYGRCRLQDKTINTFGLKGNREEMIKQFADLIKNKKAIKTVTGWQSAVNVPAKVSAAKPSKAAKAEKAAPKKAKKAPAKAAPKQNKKETKKVSAPAKSKVKPGKISAKAAALVAEIASGKTRPLPASQVAIMG